MQIHTRSTAERRLRPHLLLTQEENERLRTGDDALQSEIDRNAHEYLRTHDEVFVVHVYDASNAYHGYISLATLEQYQESDATADTPHEGMPITGRPLRLQMSGQCASGNCKDCVAYMFDAVANYRCPHDCHQRNESSTTSPLS